ncbi:hypothetical protein AMECASPLE_017271 [Ameca splendens]|uniref:Uncharacterized protein n=1 Tax=Ameca splendens TaxID=208324 RepID=A0ABV0Z1J3_9TELE
MLNVFPQTLTLFPVFVFFEQKKERECMQLRIAVLRSELQRQKKALGREIDIRLKESAQLQKKAAAALQQQSHSAPPLFTADHLTTTWSCCWRF